MKRAPKVVLYLFVKKLQDYTTKHSHFISRRNLTTKKDRKSLFRESMKMDQFLEPLTNCARRQKTRIWEEMQWQTSKKWTFEISHKKKLWRRRRKNPNEIERKSVSNTWRIEYKKPFSDCKQWKYKKCKKERSERERRPKIWSLNFTV